MRSTLLAITVSMILAATSAVAGDDDSDSDSDSDSDLIKEALINLEAPDFTNIFNWGLRLKNIEELIFFAGHAAQTPDFVVQFPGMPVEQTMFILEQLDNFLQDNGLDRDDIIRIEFTLTDDVTDGEFFAILDLFEVFFEDVEVKPAAGTLRYVDRLAYPGMSVEYEIWMAK